MWLCGRCAAIEAEVALRVAQAVAGLPLCGRCRRPTALAQLAQVNGAVLCQRCEAELCEQARAEFRKSHPLDCFRCEHCGATTWGDTADFSLRDRGPRCPRCGGLLRKLGLLGMIWYS